MLNRSILAELAALEARFEAGCVVCIDLIDSCDNVVCPSHLAGFNKLSDFKKLLDEGVIEYKPVSGTNK